MWFSLTWSLCTGFCFIVHFLITVSCLFYLSTDISLHPLAWLSPPPCNFFEKGFIWAGSFICLLIYFFEGCAFTSSSKASTEVFIQGQSVGAWLWLLIKALTYNFLELMGNLETRGVGCLTARLSKVFQDGNWQFPNFEVIPLETWTHSICSCQPLLETWFSPLVGTARWSVCLAPVLDLSLPMQLHSESKGHLVLPHGPVVPHHWALLSVSLLRSSEEPKAWIKSVEAGAEKWIKRFVNPNGMNTSFRRGNWSSGSNQKNHSPTWRW